MYLYIVSQKIFADLIYKWITTSLLCGCVIRGCICCLMLIIASECFWRVAWTIYHKLNKQICMHHQYMHRSSLWMTTHVDIIVNLPGNAGFCGTITAEFHLSYQQTITGHKESIYKTNIHTIFSAFCSEVVIIIMIHLFRMCCLSLDTCKHVLLLSSPSHWHNMATSSLVTCH